MTIQLNISNLEQFANLQLKNAQTEELKGGFIIVEEVGMG